MAQIVFGVGSLFMRSGDTVAQSSKIATCSGVTIEASEEFVSLYGSSKFPLHSVPTKGKLTGKLTVAEYEPALMAAVIGGSTSATGYTSLVENEDGTIPAAPGPYTLTAAGSATFVEDYGVTDVSSGLSMLRVASSPATGQYSVDESTGVYTFASADTGKTVHLNYTKTTAGSGATLTVTNVAMGTGTSYTLFGWSEFEGHKFGYKFPTVRLGKASMAFKADGYMSPEHEFEAFAAPGATVYQIFTA